MKIIMKMENRNSNLFNKNGLGVVILIFNCSIISFGIFIIKLFIFNKGNLIFIQSIKIMKNIFLLKIIIFFNIIFS